MKVDSARGGAMPPPSSQFLATYMYIADDDDDDDVEKLRWKLRHWITGLSVFDRSWICCCLRLHTVHSLCNLLIDQPPNHNGL